MNTSFLGFTLFGAKHLWGNAIGLAIAIAALFFTFKRTNYKQAETQQKTVLTLSIIYVIFEISKISYKWITYGATYSLIPLYFCSIPIFLLPVLYFSKGKLKEFVKPALMVVCFVGSISMSFYPVPLFASSDSWFPLSENIVQIIAVLYHFLMFYTAAYIVGSGMYKPKISHLFKSIVPYLVMSALSLGTSLLVWNVEQIDYNGMVKGVDIKFVQDVMSIHPAFFILMYLGALSLCASIILWTGEYFTTRKNKEESETVTA